MTDVPLHQHWHDIHVQRWLIVVTTAAAAAVSLVFSWVVDPVYEAKTTFYLASTSATPLFVGPTPDAPAPLFPIPEEKIASLDVGILRGREIRSALADRFRLPYSEVERRVDVTVSNEFMINVFARGSDPGLVADIANAMPELYEAFHQRSMRSRAGEVAAVLEQRLDVLVAQRAEIRAQLMAARAQSLSTADVAAMTRVESERDAALTEVAALDAQMAQTAARRDALGRSLSDEGEIYALARSVNTTTALDRMLERVLDLRVDLASVTDGPNSPRRHAIEQQLAEIEGSMVNERQRLAEATAKPQGSLHEQLRLELVMVGAQMAGLAAEREAAAARVSQANARFTEILAASGMHEDAVTQLERIDAQTTVATANLAAARLQEANASPPLLVVERAVPPDRPAFPLPILNAIVAALCGLVFGTFYALFVAQSERAAQVRRSQAAAMPVFTQEELDTFRRLAAQEEVRA
jgi:uncharacterized protein involved in exopolysaccharide biosynthesis